MGKKGNSDICKSCESGYCLTPKKSCIKSINNCKGCENANECTSCISSNYKLLNGQCYECNTAFCNLIQNHCFCYGCVNGYYVSNYHCKKCGENCKTKIVLIIANVLIVMMVIF